VFVRLSELVPFAVLLALQASSAVSADGPDELQVAVSVGDAIVPLSVWSRFKDVAQALPQPGEIAPDSHRHHARSFCYSYRVESGVARLVFHDSDFGLHTATVARLGRAQDRECPLLSSEPMFLVADRRYGLSSRFFLKPAAFRAEATPDRASFTRDWKERGAANRSGCSWHQITVTAERSHGTIQSIMVQNWEEPGC
jgi:hypothetical protein